MDLGIDLGTANTVVSDGRGRIGHLAVGSVDEVGRLIRVLTFGHPSSRQVRHREPPPPNCY